MYNFTYHQASGLNQAADMLGRFEEAKLIAGGQTLLPTMKLRLASPANLIDLNRIDGLAGIELNGTNLVIGAMTRHADVADSAVVRQSIPALAALAHMIGDPAVRHRGTIGGSVVHADPASDLPATLLALDATLVAQGGDGSREIPIGEFFQGFLETALEPDELLTEIRVPKPLTGGWSFQKFTQRAIDWAIVGCAVTDGRVALINMAGTPMRAAAVETALADGAPPADAATRAAEGTSAASDIRATREYREHLARVLVSRALAEAGART